MNSRSGTLWFVSSGQTRKKPFQDALIKSGMNLHLFEDGRSAFARFGSDMPDLLLVSEQLDDMNVVEFCQRLRLTAGTRSVPVIVLTSGEDTQFERDLLNNGADVCFCQNTDPLLLVFRICTLLRRYEDDMPASEGVRFRPPAVTVITTPGSVAWSWRGGKAESQDSTSPLIFESLTSHGYLLSLIDDPARFDDIGTSVSQQHPDCVIIDMDSPQFDGLEMARNLLFAREINGQCTRVLGMVTPDRMTIENVVAAFSAGVDDLVGADIETDLLMARIGSLVRRKILQDEMRREEAHVESARARMALADALRRVNADLAAANRKLIEAQAKLVQSAKMASLGELAAGIAHEFNNPLAFVLAHESTVQKGIATALQAVKTSDFDGAELALTKSKERLSASLVGLSRMRDLVASLRRFSRLEEGEFARVDVPESLKIVLTLLAPKFGQEIKVFCHLNAPAELVCQAALVNQVIMNILSNSADAIAEKRINNKEINNIENYDEINIFSSIEEATEGREGKDYVIRITDTGPGVPENLRERIFEPFFTTKPVGSGTGLGLATAYGVIKAHGGSISVTGGEQGKGACFVVRVPYRSAEEKGCYDET